MSEMKLFMEYLVENRARDLPADALAEVFDRLLWCTADNGEEILSVRREWLDSNGLYNVRVALAMSEVFPCNTRDEMVELFGRICSRWPELNGECEKWLIRWDNQKKS